ncbi:MAG: ABC transporter permease, partial [Candidatus Bipolaricaulis sp.]|nr:ABC transporter permease [Candidatus Bipolaricaulis sp.]
MLAYILKRLLVSIPTLIVVTLVVFVAMKLVPGDPARMLAGELAQPNEIQAIRKELGLDKPLITQYLAYLRGLLRGDLGVSYRSKRPVARELVLRYPNTIRLALSSLFLAVLFGVITGVVSAARQGSIIDKASRIVALLGVTTPTFWLGLMLLLLFAVHWDVFPAAYVPG